MIVDKYSTKKYSACLAILFLANYGFRRGTVHCSFPPIVFLCRARILAAADCCADGADGASSSLSSTVTGSLLREEVEVKTTKSSLRASLRVGAVLTSPMLWISRGYRRHRVVVCRGVIAAASVGMSPEIGGELLIIILRGKFLIVRHL